ncbi:MAG: PKD domain-containing protein [Chitinophagales bacterium]
MKKTLLFLLAFICTAAGLFAHGSAASSALQFTENKGQWNEAFRFKAQIPNGQLLLEKNAFYYFLYSGDDISKIHHPGGTDVTIHGHAFREEFVGANPQPTVMAENAFTQYANYYHGKDPKRWASHVKIYAKVRYQNLFNGIDLVLYSKEEQQLKYDFVVAAGADVSKIKIRFNGADDIALSNGSLKIKTSVADVIEQRPYAYQEINGFKVEVKCDFKLQGNEVSFELPDGYNAQLPLIIDPNVVFSSYTGSTADNWGYTATYDNQENMYIGGYVNAIEFGTGLPNGIYPTTVGAFQTTWAGGTGGQSGSGNGIAYSCDMGITKFSADGTQLLYSTYIGGSDNETPHSLVVDAQNNLIIYGVSYSSDYPVTANAFDQSNNSNGDIVVTKLNAAGSALMGSTFIGGTSLDGINFDPQEFSIGNLKRNYGDQNRGEVNIDAAGNIYVASCTKSADFPVTAGALQSSNGGNQDGCAFKLNADCSQLLWCTYMGGSNDDACYSLDLGPNGTLYVAGGSMSSNFPTTSGALHTAYMGGTYDGFLALINASGTQLLNSSFIGTGGDDQVYFVKLDANGNVYCVGQTTGNYPVANAAYSNPASGQFIVKLNPALNSVFYSTVFGNGNGLPNISPTAFLVDTCENVYVAGWGNSTNSIFSQYGFPANNMFNMPLTGDAYQSTTDGIDFYFIVLSKNAQSLLYGSYFGGAGNGTNTGIEHVDGGTSRFDKRGVIYEAMCAGCGGNSLTPTTAGVWAPNNMSSNCNELGLKMAFNLSGTSVELQAFPRATGCVPLTVQFQGTISNAQSFTWYFGDGGTSTLQNPQHTYMDTGTYTVMLVGLDSNSCNVSDTAYIDVWVRDDSLAADFLPDLQIDCDSNKVFLTSASYATTSYFWNLGDAATSTNDSVTHYYANPGNYTITLILSDTTKCNLQDTFISQIHIPAKVNATLNNSSAYGCRPFTTNFNTPFSATASYLWNFGDNSTSTLSNVTHTFTTADTFDVVLIVTDTTSCNIADTAYSTVIVIDSSADAAFNFSRTFFGCDSVQVTVWSTYTGEDSELWDFGDGFTSTLDSVSHTYSVAGTFTISHYLTDVQQVCHPVDTEQIAVSLLPLNISMTIPDTIGCLPFTADFIGNSILLSTDFTWYFGDGGVGTGDTVSHTYNGLGTFDVTVLGIDTNACVGADSAFGKVTVIDDFVNAAFGLNILNDCDSNLVIDLPNQSVNGVDFFWDFGDGTGSTQQNESHTYNMPGTYNITLVAIDTNRCHPIDSVTRPVTLLPNVAIDFTVTDVCLGSPVQFTNLSNPAAQFFWSFGDNSSSTQYSPTHNYAVNNIYSVRLVIVDSGTCDVRDTLVKEVTVYAQPQAAFITQGDTFKFENPVDFINKSLFYDYLLWNFGDGDSSSEENPTHAYETIYGMTVCLRAYNDVCADTFCKNIFISYDGLLGVPNAFSPNGDGINDVIKIEGRGIVELSFRIFNRWGEKVFETNDKNIGWDGYYKGVLQEMEVYTYAVEATLINGQTVPLKGNITLVR